MNTLTKIRRFLMNITPFEFAHYFGYKSQMLEEGSQGYLLEIKNLNENKIFCWGEKEKLVITASTENHSHILKYLISCKVQVNAENNLALMNACKLGHEKIVELLLKNGSNPNANKTKALKYASFKGNINIVKLLIAHGAKVNIDNNKAMRIASQKGHFEIVKYYSTLGVNILTIKTAIDAVVHDNLDFLFYMRNANFNLQKYNFLLTLACYNSSMKVMEFLIKNQENQENFKKDFFVKITENRAISAKWLKEYIKKIEYYNYLNNKLPEKIASNKRNLKI